MDSVKLTKIVHMGLCLETFVEEGGKRNTWELSVEKQNIWSKKCNSVSWESLFIALICTVLLTRSACTVFSLNVHCLQKDVCPRECWTSMWMASLFTNEPGLAGNVIFHQKWWENTRASCSSQGSVLGNTLIQPHVAGSPLTVLECKEGLNLSLC